MRRPPRSTRTYTLVPYTTLVRSFALGRPEVSNEVRNAADAAVGASLSVLEEAACRVRRGKGGHTVLDGDGFVAAAFRHRTSRRSEEHTSELQSLMRISSAVFCLTKKNQSTDHTTQH